MAIPDSIAADMENLPFKKRVVLRVAPAVIASYLRVVRATNRATETGAEHITDLEEQGQSYLMAIWHESVATALPRLGKAKVSALTSKSYDGALAAALIEQFGVRALRGSSSRGGREALAEMVKQADGLLAIGLTIDGPRGPRREAKPGIAALSQHTGIPVIPIASCSTRSFRLRSWDRTCIPLPFGLYVYLIGAPIAPAESSERESVREKSLEIQVALNGMHATLESEYGIDPKL